MRRTSLALTACTLLAATPLSAGDLQDRLRSRWLGAWVLVTAEISSDCAGLHTNNLVNGPLVLGDGAREFQVGELGRVVALDLKRSRVDVFLDLQENVLVPYHDGPFELYREADCKVELLVEVPRSMVKGRDVEGIEERLLQVMERHAARADAVASAAWNGRRREPYPPDYDRRLAEHARWRVLQWNGAVDAKLLEAEANAQAVLARVSTEEPGYGDAFAHGIETMSSHEFDDCDRMVGTTFDAWAHEVPEGWHEGGFHDGQLLAYSLRIADRVAGCYLAVPEVPEEAPVAAAQPSADARPDL